eukprot:g2051.t1
MPGFQPELETIWEDQPAHFGYVVVLPLDDNENEEEDYEQEYESNSYGYSNENLSEEEIYYQQQQLQFQQQQEQLQQQQRELYHQQLLLQQQQQRELYEQQQQQEQASYYERESQLSQQAQQDQLILAMMEKEAAQYEEAERQRQRYTDEQIQEVDQLGEMEEEEEEGMEKKNELLKTRIPAEMQIDAQTEEMIHLAAQKAIRAEQNGNAANGPAESYPEYESDSDELEESHEDLIDDDIETGKVPSPRDSGSSNWEAPTQQMAESSHSSIDVSGALADMDQSMVQEESNTGHTSPNQSLTEATMLVGDMSSVGHDATMLVGDLSQADMSSTMCVGDMEGVDATMSITDMTMSVGDMTMSVGDLSRTKSVVEEEPTTEAVADDSIVYDGLDLQEDPEKYYEIAKTADGESLPPHQLNVSATSESEKVWSPFNNEEEEPVVEEYLEGEEVLEEDIVEEQENEDNVVEEQARTRSRSNSVLKKAVGTKTETRPSTGDGVDSQLDKAMEQFASRPRKHAISLETNPYKLQDEASLSPSPSRIPPANSLSPLSLSSSRRRTSTGSSEGELEVNDLPTFHLSAPALPENLPPMKRSLPSKAEEEAALRHRIAINQNQIEMVRPKLRKRKPSHELEVEALIVLAANTNKARASPAKAIVSPSKARLSPSPMRNPRMSPAKMNARKSPKRPGTPSPQKKPQFEFSPSRRKSPARPGTPSPQKVPGMWGEYAVAKALSPAPMEVIGSSVATTASKTTDKLSTDVSATQKTWPAKSVREADVAEEVIKADEDQEAPRRGLANTSASKNNVRGEQKKLASVETEKENEMPRANKHRRKGSFGRSLSFKNADSQKERG